MILAAQHRIHSIANGTLNTSNEIIDGIERKKEMESSSIIWGDEPQKIRKEIEKSIY